MKENYDKKMTELLKDLPKGTPLLLHSCCAPCSSACLETLKEHFQLTVFYYNPNIGDEAEYLKRKAEQIRFLKETGWAKLLDCDHDAAAFIGIVRGLEGEPERGRRCYRCYKLRLDAAAEAAKKNGFQWFCTTLTLSPYKNAEWLNELGQAAGERFGVHFLPSDFKKRLWAVPTGFLRVRLFEGGNGKAEAGKKSYFGIKFFRLLPLPRTVFFGDSYAPRLT